MDKSLETALKEAGWNIGDAADFLGMTDEQRQILDLRMEMAKAIRARRAALKLSQNDLANRLNSSQSRVSLIEAADPDVSLDQLAKTLILLGGKLVVEKGGTKRSPTKSGAKRSSMKQRPAKSLRNTRKTVGEVAKLSLPRHTAGKTKPAKRKGSAIA